jgi:hypothetical protein
VGRILARIKLDRSLAVAAETWFARVDTKQRTFKETGFVPRDRLPE